jgi:tetratricopeptide (TPR) repeat protein
MNNLALSYDAGRRTRPSSCARRCWRFAARSIGPEHPDTLKAMHNLAISYDDAGRRDEALKLREEVLALRRKVLGPEHPDTLRRCTTWRIPMMSRPPGRGAQTAGAGAGALRKVSGPGHPQTVRIMEDLAISYGSAGRRREALTVLAQACEIDPKNSNASLALATWQTWFGQDADYEATRRRLVQQAEGTAQADPAERAAEAACLRPSDDAALMANALNLAQRAVELGKSSLSLPWYQLSLGLAEYRNGQYAAAERSMAVAEQTAGDRERLLGIAHMFHAMTLFRQDRPDEARKLFSQAEAQMPRCPR